MNTYIAILGAVFVLMGAVGVYHEHKALPEGFSYAGEVHHIAEEDVIFLLDRTVMRDGERILEHEIFDTIFDTIRNAEDYVLADYFLFNDFGATEEHRPLTTELTQALIDSSANTYLITDPINTVYEGVRKEHIERLRASHVHVTLSNHNLLREANLVYSPVYRTFLSHTRNNPDGGWIINILGEGRVTLRSYWHMLTFRANHRKVLVADSDDDVITIISTANPHDASSAHTNMAVAIRGNIAQDVWKTGVPLAAIPPPPLAPQRAGNVTAQLVTERAIKDAILRELSQATEEDTVHVGAFYLSDSDVIHALIAAHNNGASVHVLLDPNTDAFGLKKDGVPNTQAARILHRAGVHVRWFDTHGEQFHTKMLVIHRADGTSTLIIGSANFTRRNLDGYNLETSVVLASNTQARFMQDLKQYFLDAWENRNGHYSVAYEVYADERMHKHIQYHIMERLGVGTF